MNQGATQEPLLRVRGLEAGYGDVQVLWGIDLDVPSNTIVSVVGANGAGKTTLLLALRSEEHTSELQSRGHLVCRLLLEKKKTRIFTLFPLKKKKNQNNT